jgi:hypothetical protein
MKKVVRLTEYDLARLVKKVIRENEFEEYDEDDMGDLPKEKQFGDGNENEMYLTNNVRFYRKGGKLILSYTPTKIMGGIKISDKQKQMLIDFLSK